MTVGKASIGNRCGVENIAGEQPAWHGGENGVAAASA
jgi:hypothetical protein